MSSVARRQTDTKVKMVLKIPFFKISKNKKMRFFLMSQGSFSPKIRFLGQKVCSVARTHTFWVKMALKITSRTQTDRQTDRQTRKWIQRTPFQVSGFFSFNLSSRIGPIINQWCQNMPFQCFFITRHNCHWQNLQEFICIYKLARILMHMTYQLGIRLMGG